MLKTLPDTIKNTLTKWWTVDENFSQKYIEEIPMDGTPVIITRIVRFLPYKGDNQFLGRWQQQDINGYWRACDPPYGYNFTKARSKKNKGA